MPQKASKTAAESVVLSNGRFDEVEIGKVISSKESGAWYIQLRQDASKVHGWRDGQNGDLAAEDRRRLCTVLEWNTAGQNTDVIFAGILTKAGRVRANAVTRS